MEEFHDKCIAHLLYRRDVCSVEFAVIGIVDAVSELFVGKIAEKEPHDLERDIPVIHFSKLIKRRIKNRELIRYE